MSGERTMVLAVPMDRFENPEASPDNLVIDDQWSDLRKHRELPEIDISRLYDYRENP